MQTVVERDLRIDFFRGLALWMIFADHVGENPLRFVTYHRIGLSDASEIFVFLSGVSCSILYGKLLARQGWRAAVGPAVHRAAQIYIGYALVTLATAAIFLLGRGVVGDA